MRELCILVGVLANRRSWITLLAIVGYPLKTRAKNLAGGFELVKLSKGISSTVTPGGKSVIRLLFTSAAQLGAAARLGQPNLVVTLELVGQCKGSYPSEQDEYSTRLGGCGVLREKLTTNPVLEKAGQKKIILCSLCKSLSIQLSPVPN